MEYKEKLLINFLRISKIPRESGQEEKIANFFVDVAKKNNLYYFKDENNNVLIKKKGNINSNSIALQAHLDMVCVKRKGVNHDFKNNGIDVIIEGNKVTARDTSLGADQGVGLAMMLTIMEDKNLNHPNLEFILTTEEETTFNGAVTFPYKMVDSKILINLDGSKDDVVYIGSDGDILNEYTFKGCLVENNLPSYKIKIDGFPGGNSGDKIELSRDNAIIHMAKILKNKKVFLNSINGGAFENDLATFCEVIINTNLDVNEIFNEENVIIEKIDNRICFSPKDTENIIDEILNLKCGFITSNNSSGNLGMIRTSKNIVKIKYIIRGIEEIELENLNNQSKELGHNFEVKEIYRDSIWKPNIKSKLLDKYKKIYFKEYQKYPKEDIGHGGTECSAIIKSIDNLDVISIGANMDNNHTIEEVTYIDSWEKTFNLLIKLLEEI